MPVRTDFVQAREPMDGFYWLLSKATGRIVARRAKPFPNAPIVAPGHSWKASSVA